MLAFRFLFPRTEFYWSLLAAAVCVAAFAREALPQSKPKPAAVPAEYDLLTEWQRVNGAAMELRDRLKQRPKDEPARKQMAELAIRSARGAERALAIGDASLFASYRTQLREQFHDTRWRIGELAKAGDGAAEFTLGVLAVHGILEPVDLDKACKAFAAALEKGFRGARFRLAQCLEKSDPQRSAQLMRGVADAGHAMASELIGRGCLESKPPDAACAYERLTVAAAAGRPSAQSLLAWMYTQGVGGKADPARAARLYLQAARAGDAAAQNNVGELYETGRGVAADPKQALDWYRKAAEAGFAPAQFNLGRMYASGTGTPRDFAQARPWLERAAAAGIPAARQLLDWMANEKSSN